MNRSRIILNITTLILPCICLADASFINDIPDFNQSGIRGPDTLNGEYFCGPVSVSNSIVWLSKHRINQLQLIHLLASKDYMNTDIRRGTRVSRLLRGVDKITKELFGGYKTLVYEGWRFHPGQFSTGNKIPTVEKLQSAISKNTAAWINVGWYQYDNNNNTYIRNGGHWVTLVGYADGQLILHDPAPRAGDEFANEFVEFSIIQNGTLVGRNAELPFPAKGLIRLGKGMHINTGADYAIVDGVVYLEL